MKLFKTQPIYITNGDLIEININPARIREQGFINFTGYTWVDRKYKFLVNLIKTLKVPIITDSDVISHDLYIDNLLREETIVIMYMGESDKKQPVPSIKRRKRAVEKLIKRGVNVIMFETMDELNKLKENNFKYNKLPENVIKGNFPLTIGA